MNRLGTSALDVYPLCLGGNVFGWTADRETSFGILDAYVGGGGNFLDTADAYSYWATGNGGGESEIIIGDWMADRGNRDSLIVATKVGKMPGLEGLSAETIRRGCDDSLRRLQTDYLDLYYCHADDPDTPLEETLTALGDLVEEGKVRYIAASNYSAQRLEEAVGISDALGLPRFVALQPHYSLMVRDEYEGAVMDVCAREGISCLPYYPLAGGFLTGKYRSTDIEGPRAPTVTRHAHDRGWRVLDALDRVAEEHGCSLATIAVAWLLHRPTVAAPIASATSRDQLAQIMEAVHLDLSPADMTLLDLASEPGD